MVTRAQTQEPIIIESSPRRPISRVPYPSPGRCRQQVWAVMQGPAYQDFSLKGTCRSSLKGLRSFDFCVAGPE